MKPRSNQSKQLYIFDLDGTLVDAYSAIEKSLNFTRHRLGYKRVSYVQVKKNVGHGDKAFIQYFFRNSDVSRALRIYRAHHKAALARFSRCMPFAKSLLKRLRKKNKKVAIASNRPAPFARILTEHLSIAPLVDYAVYAGMKYKIKPNPQMLNVIMQKFNVSRARTVYIGDMALDMDTAKRAKVQGVFVKGGSSSVRELKGYKTIKRIRSLKEVATLYA